MPIAKPARLTLKWWKSNYPKSMPTNREVEAAIRAFEAGTPAKMTARFQELLGTQAGKPVTATAEAIKTETTFYIDLKDHLKRTKAMLTKAKHEELAALMDDLAEDVRKEQEKVAKVAKALAKEMSVKAGAKSSVDWEQELKQIGPTHLDVLKKINSALPKVERMARDAAADTEMDKKDKAEALIEAVGRNRFIGRDLAKRETKLRERAKEAEKSAKAGKDVEDAMTFATEAKRAAPQFAAVITASELLDKELVKICVSTFGDKAGKKVFMAAKPVVLKY